MAPGGMEITPVSHALLVETYISALPLAEVAIVGAGRRCRIHTDGGDLAPGETIAHRYFFKSSSHVHLLLATIGKEGLAGKPAGALAELVVQAAASIGAPYQTPDEVRKAAEQQVDEIVARIKASALSGKLKKWNTRYRQYRLAQVEKREKAIGIPPF